MYPVNCCIGVKKWEDRVIVLINNGCDITVTDLYGYDLLQLAIMAQSDEIINILRFAGYAIRAERLDILQTKFKQTILQVLELFSDIMTLKNICRIRIRQQLRRPLVQNVRKLGLPKVLEKFLVDLQ